MQNGETIQENCCCKQLLRDCILTSRQDLEIVLVVEVLESFCKCAKHIFSTCSCCLHLLVYVRLCGSSKTLVFAQYHFRFSIGRVSIGCWMHPFPTAITYQKAPERNRQFTFVQYVLIMFTKTIHCHDCYSIRKRRELQTNTMATFQSNTRSVNRLRTIKKHKRCNEPKITALPSVILEIYLLQNADSRIFGDKQRGGKKAFFFMTLTKCHIENDTVTTWTCELNVVTIEI